VISDGREIGSDASYSDTLKVLLTQNIIVYAVAWKAPLCPGISNWEDPLAQVNVPDVADFKLRIWQYLIQVRSRYRRPEPSTRKTRKPYETAYDRAVGDARNHTRSPTLRSPELWISPESKY